MSDQILFLGAGNMAEALINGMLAGKNLQPEQLTLCDLRADRLEELQARYGVQVSQDAASALSEASEVWLCVKPQQMQELLEPFEAGGRLWVSIAAGLSTARLAEWLGGEARVVRVMPNTPALIQEGAAGVVAGAGAAPGDLDRVLERMRCVGLALPFDDEEAIHAVTALSGSGPAYVFYLAEAMLRGAGELNIPEAEARQLVAQTLLGAGKLLAESDVSASELRERVTSKGGTTAAALARFDEGGAGEALTQGVLAAAARSRELA